MRLTFPVDCDGGQGTAQKTKWGINHEVSPPWPRINKTEEFRFIDHHPKVYTYARHGRWGDALSGHTQPLPRSGGRFSTKLTRRTGRSSCDVQSALVNYYCTIYSFGR